MDWLTSTWVSVLGAAIWSALVVLIRLVYERSGTLAGTWYQVTYYADDPAMRGIPWSIEIVRVRHHGAVARGTMWRIHWPYVERQWAFWARYEDGHFVGTYWRRRGDGGRGSMDLWCLSNGNLMGFYIESKLVRGRAGREMEDPKAPLEWVRVGSPDEVRVLPWLDLADHAQMKRQMPHRLVRLIRRRLLNCQPEHGEEAHSWRRQLLEACGYVGSLVDLSGPLAIEEEKKRRRAGAAER